jgi:hypothetical protein
MDGSFASIISMMSLRVTWSLVLDVSSEVSGTSLLPLGRGGTCDISAWDGFYLAAFWMLNTIGSVTFYWHWKHITLVTNNLSLWIESSTYLMGWLRDYLWFNSSLLPLGYELVATTPWL